MHFHPPYRVGPDESCTFSWGPLPGFPRLSRLIFSPLRSPQLMMGPDYENGLGDQPRASRPRSRKVTQKPVPGISLRAYPCTVCGEGRAPGRLRAKTTSPAAETPQIRNLHAPRGPMVGALWACNASRPWHMSGRVDFFRSQPCTLKVAHNLSQREFQPVRPRASAGPCRAHNTQDELQRAKLSRVVPETLLATLHAA